MAAKKRWVKGKLHSRVLANGRKQRGRWLYPYGKKKGRKWDKK